ncbi:hypothetical protein HQ560_01070 [bacterium]|nr:hypothetical protein [bacterium]
MRRSFLTIALASLVLASGLAVQAADALAVPGPTGVEAEQAPKKTNPVVKYFCNRGKDFSDIFNLKIALGDGGSLLANVRLTRLLQIGGGRFKGTKIGFQGPSAGIYGEGRVEAGLSVFYWAWIGRRTSDKSISAHAQKTNRFFGHVEDILVSESYHEYYDANRPWYTVGGAFALPFLPGIEAEVNPAEAVDFVLSWIPIPAFRIPPPFYKTTVDGEKIPAPYSIRWHGQEQFEKYD